eukprot:3306741-Rhodomonas_salina.1
MAGRSTTRAPKRCGFTQRFSERFVPGMWFPSLVFDSTVAVRCMQCAVLGVLDRVLPLRDPFVTMRDVWYWRWLCCYALRTQSAVLTYAKPLRAPYATHGTDVRYAATRL